MPSEELLVRSIAEVLGKPEKEKDNNQTIFSSVINGRNPGKGGGLCSSQISGLDQLAPRIPAHI